MTTAVHTPSRVCYLNGCGQPECELANYRYMAALRLDHSRGIRRLRDSAPVLEHVQRLMANEWTVRQIADVSGVSMSAIRYVLYGQPTINRERARALLSIPVGPPPADPTVVDATGTIRRLRALACLGHTLDNIGTEAGISRWRLGRIRCGNFTEVEASVAQAITDVYRRLSASRGDCAFTIHRATKHGWHGPLAWDDNIDDPAATPERSEPYEAAPKYERDPDRKAEIEHLYLLGESIPAMAKQLGNTEKYIGDQLAVILRERQQRAEQERAAARQQILIRQPETEEPVQEPAAKDEQELAA